MIESQIKRNIVQNNNYQYANNSNDHASHLSHYAAAAESASARRDSESSLM